MLDIIGRGGDVHLATAGEEKVSESFGSVVGMVVGDRGCCA